MELDSTQGKEEALVKRIPPEPEHETTERYPLESIRAEEPAPSEMVGTLTMLKGPRLGAVYRLKRGRNVLGRARDAAVRISLDAISRYHAQILVEDTSCLLEDLGSTNGTHVRGDTIEGPVQLSDGDRINLGGEVVLRFAREGVLEQRLREDLYDLATRDPLTKTYNRRVLQERMDSEWPWAVRHEKACSLLAIDVDHFKDVNDTYGHCAGDEVLRQVVEVIFQTIRHEDLLARVGGEEFAVLCRATSLHDARVLAERIRSGVAGEPFTWRGREIVVTVSIGVAASTETDIESPEALSGLADKRLYAAKERGRNCVDPQPDR